jgi:hypothetical protein
MSPKKKRRKPRPTTAARPPVSTLRKIFDPRASRGVDLRLWFVTRLVVVVAVIAIVLAIFNPR